MGCLTHSFTDVPVVPGVTPIQTATKGGPIWPDFTSQSLLRHCRNGVPVDLEPLLSAAPKRAMPQAVWGCFLDLRFGHLIAEHLSRLPLALRQWPDLPVLFAAPEGVTLTTLPGWVWDIFAWIGLDASRVGLVTEPLLVDQLFACPQQEMMFNIGPSQAYLDLLTSWTDRLPHCPTALLYVTRAGLLTNGRGGLAGEGYLTQLLQDLGVAILDPATSPLTYQLQAYAGASQIVFCEGSAVHGRQLLGRIDQDIHILRRRDGHSIAQAQMIPRARLVQYHDVAGATLPVHWKSGLRRADADLRLYDVDRLFACFETLGVALRPHWSPDAYRAAAIADISAWTAARKPSAQVLAQYHQTLHDAQMLPPSLPIKTAKG